MLQKNYYLNQSARDGYRAYLQSYASYSLKKIFDVNKLDLVKVGKAFGFAVPPRVNVSIGGGNAIGSDERRSGEKVAGKKRKREEDMDEDETDDQAVDEEEGDEDEAADRPSGGNIRRKDGKQRRVERLGKRKVAKEVYKVAKDKQRQQGGKQWSR